MTSTIESSAQTAAALVARHLTFGTYRVQGDAAYNDVRRALERGIRRVDTAHLYGNEAEVFAAVRDFERAEPGAGPVHVTSKIRDNLLFHRTIEAVEASVGRLGRPLDRMLLHRPLPLRMWRALDTCASRGLVAEIGVSNYPVHRMAGLLAECAPRAGADGRGLPRRPQIHQLELHPFVGAVHPVLTYARSEGIALQGHTMLARGAFLDYPPLVRLAAKYRCSPAVLMLRWGHELGVELLFNTSRGDHLDDIVSGVFTVEPLHTRDLAEISGYHCVRAHRFFGETPPPFSDPALDALVEETAFVDEVVRRLDADRVAMSKGHPVSYTALGLPMQSNRQLLTDPTANRIAQALFPVTDKPAQSSHQRFRDLVRELRSRATEQRAASHDPIAEAPVVVKGRPVADRIANPRAMPVTVAPITELAPFSRSLPTRGPSLGMRGQTTR